MRCISKPLTEAARANHSQQVLRTASLSPPGVSLAAFFLQPERHPPRSGALIKLIAPTATAPDCMRLPSFDSPHTILSQQIPLPAFVARAASRQCCAIFPESIVSRFR
jgi:hypothetical protein